MTQHSKNNNKKERIGVYVCHCGSNIAGTVDVENVSHWAGEELKDRGVVVSRDYKFMCSSLGQELIEQDIKEQGLTRVVVAACSPHLHEKTFRTATERGGLNPYLCELCSIREQVSWVHTDKAAATEKSKAVISGAVERVIHNEPLEPLRVPIHEATMVVGGGIAGIQAALEIADAGHPVYMVEREPSIGGHMAQFDKTFPTLDCAACILTPRMVSVGTHPNVHLLTWSEVTRVDGYVGNFTVTIRKKARFIDEDLCTGCGICQEKCPKKVIDEVYEAGLGYRKAVYTPFPQAVPKYPVIDKPNCTYFQKGTCKACEKFCPTGAIDFTQEDEYITVEVGNSSSLLIKKGGVLAGLSTFIWCTSISISPVARLGFSAPAGRGRTMPSTWITHSGRTEIICSCAWGEISGLATICTSPNRSRRSIKVTPPWSRRR